MPLSVGSVSEATLAADDTENFQLEFYSLQHDLETLGDVDFSTSPDRVESTSEFDLVSGESFLELDRSTTTLAVRVTADLSIETAGNYTFYVTAADAATFTIDGAAGLLTTIQGDGSSSYETAVTFYLDSGSHALDIRYFEYSEEPMLGLEWEGPDSDGE